MVKKEKNFWWAAFLVFLLDQLTKIWAVYSLRFEKEIYISNLLSLRRIYNEDTIMMVFHNPMGLGKLGFSIIWVSFCILITLGITWVTRQPALKEDGWTQELAKTGLFIILGAAWGNAFDRIFRVGVVDFLEIKISHTLSPVINIADVLLYVGEFALVAAWCCVVYISIKNKLSQSKLNKVAIMQ